MAEELTCFFPSSRIRENSLFSVRRFFLQAVCFNGTLHYRYCRIRINGKTAELLENLILEGSSQGQSLSSFGSAAFENFTSATGGHSGAETAFVRFFDSGRLEGSLHDVFSFLRLTGIYYWLRFQFVMK